MYQRIVKPTELLRRKSLFLLGPRQTGKSTLLRQALPGVRFINLLEADTFRTFATRPETLRQSLKEHEKIIVVDEIQKVPALLDEIHNLIELNKRLRFVLTGSSARKLVRGKANLLAGRADRRYLFPLVSEELNYKKLDHRISYGSLPSLIDSEEPEKDLRNYVGIYLKEEIFAEGLSRSIEMFGHFLEMAAHCNAEQLNYTGVGNDAGIPPRTVKDHFQVLYDTMMAHELAPLHIKGSSRKEVSIAKFYFFDVGVANSLLKRGKLEPKSESYGKALEHLIFLELLTYKNYRELDFDFHFWRLHNQYEVDFVLDRSIAIEIKAAAHVSDKHLKSLRSLAKETKLKRKLLVSTEKTTRKTQDGIEILPVSDFLKELWAGNIL